MMQFSQQGMSLLKHFEGFSATPYICPAGLPTIGYGHVINDGEHFPEAGISQEAAEILLKQDVNRFVAIVNQCVTVNLSQNQFDALVCLAYNIGTHAFEKSTLLRILNKGHIEAAGNEFKKWVYSRGKRLSGLVRRRNAEAALFSGFLHFTKL